MLLIQPTTPNTARDSWLYGSLFDTSQATTLLSYVLLFASVDIFHIIGWSLWRCKIWVYGKCNGEHRLVFPTAGREQYLLFA
jgi:hypothetical protein